MSVVAMATLALGGVALAGGGERLGDKAKFDSQITLNYNQGPYDPNDPYYDEAVFKGKVTVTPANKEAKRRDNARIKCKKKRTVIIRNLDAPDGSSAFATTKTNRRGRYRVDASQAYTEPGTYRARVTKKRKVRAEVKCFGARSNTVVAPTP
ncbi:MAG: hypothetical protein M3355_08770 [Actinomycetota bacterium]|nr:hypothetical protein [Actinomycetota bacterium]